MRLLAAYGATSEIISHYFSYIENGIYFWTLTSFNFYDRGLNIFKIQFKNMMLLFEIRAIFRIYNRRNNYKFK